MEIEGLTAFFTTCFAGSWNFPELVNLSGRQIIALSGAGVLKWAGEAN